MNKLYGAILGDLAGQPYEYHFEGDINFNLHNPESHITDDSLMTLASADAVLHDIPFAEIYKKWYHLYPDDKYGYGDNFKLWCDDHCDSWSNSYGNGCLMRLAPVIYHSLYEKTNDILTINNSIECSHFHNDSLKAGYNLYSMYTFKNAIFMGEPIKDKFCINAWDTLTIVSATYLSQKNPKTQFLIEFIIKQFGGDTDTNASIIGELSNHINDDLTEDDIKYVRSKLDTYQLEILDEFNEKY